MGRSLDQPTVANLTEPRDKVPVITPQGPMFVDMQQVSVWLSEHGIELGKGDVFSISGYRNARGELVPNYDSITVEKRKEQASGATG